MVYEPAPDYENKYCKVNWYDGKQHTAEEMKQLIISDKERKIDNDSTECL